MARPTRRGRKGADYAVETTAPGWMTTYGDMVTLILAFFVILFSISSIDAGKFEMALLSLQRALGILPGGRTLSSEKVVDLGELDRDQQVKMAEIAQLKAIEDLLEGKFKAQGLQEVTSIDLQERGVLVRFLDSVLFDSGQATLKPEARKILGVIAEVAGGVQNHLRVEGHTDDVPISTSYFPSNWELSTARATQVIQFLLSRGISPERLSAAGYGEYRPIASNETIHGRQQNRRVDMVFLRLSLSGIEPENFERRAREQGHLRPSLGGDP